MNSPATATPAVSFDVEGERLEVRDELEAEALDLTVPGLDGYTQAAGDLFVFPVDDAVAFDARSFTVGPNSVVNVRDGSGDHLGELSTSERQFPAGVHYLDVAGPVKAYVRIEGDGFTARHRSAPLHSPVDVGLDGAARVTVGARSFHSRPQATVTVPADPAGVAAALPYLGSAVKEWSCERSWPTLRGHPPAFRVGDGLDVPAVLAAPDTGVTVRAPFAYESLYRVAPLVYYLGADVERGDEPAVVLENGHIETLGAGTATVAESVQELLSRCLVLDSLVRIGGYYAQERNEYEALAGELPFYPPNLYGASVSAQLTEYLEVEATTLDPVRPQWPAVATLAPRAGDAELLPYLADAFAPIHVTPDGAPASAPTTRQPGPHAPLAGTADAPASGTGRLLPAGYRNALHRPLADSQEAVYAFHVADAECAAALREYLATGRQSRLHDDTDGVHGPDGPVDEGRDAPDFVYWEGESGVDLHALAERDPAPRVVVTGTHVDPERAAALVDAGVVSVLITDRPSVPEVGRLASTLAIGHSVERAAAVAGLDDYRSHGRPAAVLARLDHGLGSLVIHLRSRQVDRHELWRLVPPGETMRLGATARALTEHPNDDHHLVGTAAAQSAAFDSESVLEEVRNDDHVVCLNDTYYHGEGPLDEDSVRACARRVLEN